MTENSQQTPEPQKTPSQRMTLAKTLGIAVEFGFIVALPLLLFVFLGKWLDHKYHTVFIVYIGITLALAASTLWFYKRIVDLMNDMKK